MMQEESITNLLYRLISKCRISDQEIMEQLNLSPAQFNFFLTLPMEMDSICCSDAAAILQLSQSRSSRIIDALVKNGFVERKNAIHDRRRTEIKLTPKGQEIKKIIDQYKERCEKSILNKLSNEEIQTFKQNLEKLYKALE